MSIVGKTEKEKIPEVNEMGVGALGRLVTKKGRRYGTLS